jgi:hypothetical protein
MCCGIGHLLLKLAADHGYLVQVSEIECGSGAFYLSSEKQGSAAPSPRPAK